MPPQSDIRDLPPDWLLDRRLGRLMAGQPPNEETGKAGNASRLTIVLVPTPLSETNTVLLPKNLDRIRILSASDRVINQVSMHSKT